MASHAIEDAFMILSCISALAVFLLPMLTMYQIYRLGSTIRVDPFPYILAQFSALMAIYPAIVTDDIVTIAVQSCGLFLESVYVVIYYIYSPQINRRLVRWAASLSISIGLVEICTTHFAVKGEMELAVVSWIALFALFSYIGLVQTVCRAYRNGTVESISIALSVFLAVSGCVQFIYAMLTEKYITATTSALGFAMCLIQVGVYVKVASMRYNISFRILAYFNRLFRSQT